METYNINTTNQPTVKAGSIILDKNNNTILVHQTNGLWSLPKGSIKYNESDKNAVIRETLEETGINVSNIDVETIFKIEEKKSTYVFYLYKLPINKSEISLIKSNEINNHIWVNINNINAGFYKSYPVNNATKIIICKLKSYIIKHKNNKKGGHTKKNKHNKRRRTLHK
jgi:8-oxo-dGTP pyrophosphatase MutT (NUDIX family)